MSDEPETPDPLTQPLIMPLRHDLLVVFTPAIWGVRHMAMNHGSYAPDPPPPPPEGGTPVASNVVNFRKRAQGVKRPIANTTMTNPASPMFATTSLN